MDINKHTKLKELNYKDYITILGIISTIMFFVLVGLDYILFTKTFHFQPAAFVNIYFSNLDIFGSQFFLIFGLIPILVGLVFILIPIMSTIIPILIMEKSGMYIKKIDFNFYILYSVHFIIISLLGFIVLRMMEEKGFFTSIYFFIVVFCALSFTYILTYIATLKNSCWTIAVLLFGLLCVIVYLLIQKILLDPKYFLLFMFFLSSLSIISIYISTLYYLSKDEKKKKEIFLFINFFFPLLIIFVIYTYIGDNSIRWKAKINESSKHSSATLNLFLNTYWLSSNNTKIVLETNSIMNNNDTTVCITDTNISLSEDESVLSLPKANYLYFKEINDNNLTCIYAVEKHYYQGKPVYNLLDTGYIDNNETKN